MSIRELALQGIESTINGLIALDPQAARRLSAFHGRVICIDLRGTGIALYFIPGHSGELQVFSRYDGEPDCTIEGSPLDLMRASDKQTGSAQLFAGHVALSGDTELGHRFSEILGSLNIDWEEQLAKLVGDVAAHELGRQVRGASEHIKRDGKTLAGNLGEYLTEEARLLPHRYEVEAWQEDVERTRDDLERLIARVTLLEPKA